MAETKYWCNMISILFYIMLMNYYLNFFLKNDFNSIGNEFASVVVLGLIAILQKK